MSHILHTNDKATTEPLFPCLLSILNIAMNSEFQGKTGVRTIPHQNISQQRTNK